MFRFDLSQGLWQRRQPIRPGNEDGIYVTDLTLPKLLWRGREPKQLRFQPRSQGLRGETVTKTLVKFNLSFQNFGKKIACAVRHNRIAITVEYGCVTLRMRFFSQNFGTIERILPGSSSPSHREGPGTEVAKVSASLAGR